MNLLDKLNWRYATKTFETNKKVDKQDIEFIKEAIRLSVSSYGLQLYKIIIIENREIRQELRKASWDQSQITDASHLFLFCNYTNSYDRHVDDYIHRIAQAGESDIKTLEQYGTSIKESIKKMSVTERNSWSEKQTYIAMSNLLVACAELKIDACPMEGFDKHAYNQILGLDEMDLNVSVIAAVGYRSQKDATQYRRKVRKTKEELYETT